VVSPTWRGTRRGRHRCHARSDPRLGARAEPPSNDPEQRRLQIAKLAGGQREVVGRFVARRTLTELGDERRAGMVDAKAGERAGLCGERHLVGAAGELDRVWRAGLQCDVGKLDILRREHSARAGQREQHRRTPHAGNLDARRTGAIQQRQVSLKRKLVDLSCHAVHDRQLRRYRGSRKRSGDENSTAAATSPICISRKK